MFGWFSRKQPEPEPEPQPEPADHRDCLPIQAPTFLISFVGDDYSDIQCAFAIPHNIPAEHHEALSKNLTAGLDLMLREEHWNYLSGLANEIAARGGPLYQRIAYEMSRKIQETSGNSKTAAIPASQVFARLFGIKGE